MLNKPVTTTILAVCLAALTLRAAEKPRKWESAKVLAQNLTSSPGGAYAAPLGTGAIAIPIYRRSNAVVVETSTYRYEWGEVGRRAIILPVNGTIRFYRDGNWFVVLDAKRNKHKFELIGMTARTSPEPAETPLQPLPTKYSPRPDPQLPPPPYVGPPPPVRP